MLKHIHVQLRIVRNIHDIPWILTKFQDAFVQRHSHEKEKEKEKAIIFCENLERDVWCISLSLWKCSKFLWTGDFQILPHTFDLYSRVDPKNSPWGLSV